MEIGRLMPVTYYILIDEESIIRDAVTYPVEGYIEIQTSGPLPAGINGGWYKWENGAYVEYPELKPETELEQRISELEFAIAALLGGAM
jgi:hypothetical protein